MVFKTRQHIWYSIFLANYLDRQFSFLIPWIKKIMTQKSCNVFKGKMKMFELTLYVYFLILIAILFDFYMFRTWKQNSIILITQVINCFSDDGGTLQILMKDSYEIFSGLALWLLYSILENRNCCITWPLNHFS